MEDNIKLDLILQKIEELKIIFIKNNNCLFDNWISWNEAKDFFDYGSTQMSTLEKNGELLISKVGRRKYIHRDSVIRLLERNIVR
jgi:hypothetical protein